MKLLHARAAPIDYTRLLIVPLQTFHIRCTYLPNINLRVGLFRHGKLLTYLFSSIDAIFINKYHSYYKNLYIKSHIKENITLVITDNISYKLLSCTYNGGRLQLKMKYLLQMEYRRWGIPDNMDHGANTGPAWVLSAYRPQVCPM